MLILRRRVQKPCENIVQRKKKYRANEEDEMPLRTLQSEFENRRKAVRDHVKKHKESTEKLRSTENDTASVTTQTISSLSSIVSTSYNLVI